MIPIQNIYYMLSYAFQTLQEKQYSKLATESFQNTADLFTAILIRGLSSQLRQGLPRDYVPKTEQLSNLQGKLNITESIKKQTSLRKQMVCEYDEYSVDTEMNRIIKTTALLLLKQDVDKGRKKELRKLLLFLDAVRETDLHTVNWNLHYNHNNATCRMLIAVCYMAYKGLLQTQRSGSMKMMDFLDEQRMCRLYEKFILEYYRKEHRELTANASKIDWQLDDESETDLLPDMKTDITLTEKNNPDRVLIIDAKYYAAMTQVQFGVHTLHSNNLYQIFTYVKNKEYELRDVSHSVSGMLLYAQTDEEELKPQSYLMSGNRISVRALDLNMDFAGIREQMDDIVEEWQKSISAGMYKA